MFTDYTVFTFEMIRHYGRDLRDQWSEKFKCRRDARPSLGTEGAFYSHNITRIISLFRRLSEMRKAISPVLISSISVLKTELCLFLSALSEEPWTSTVLFQLRFWQRSYPAAIRALLAGRLIVRQQHHRPGSFLPLRRMTLHFTVSFHCCSFWGWKPHYSGLWSCDLAHSRSEVCAPQRGRLRLQGHSRAFLFLQGKGLARLRAHVFQGIPIPGHTMLWVYLKECCQHKPKGNF